MSDIDDVKKKAAVLKATIEMLLKTFRDTTGYVAEVKVENKVKKTNDGNKVFPVVTVALTIQ